MKAGLCIYTPHRHNDCLLYTRLKAYAPSIDEFGKGTNKMYHQLLHELQHNNSNTM